MRWFPNRGFFRAESGPGGGAARRGICLGGGNGEGCAGGGARRNGGNAIRCPPTVGSVSDFRGAARRHHIFEGPNTGGGRLNNPWGKNKQREQGLAPRRGGGVGQNGGFGGTPKNGPRGGPRRFSPKRGKFRFWGPQIGRPFRSSFEINQKNPGHSGDFPEPPGVGPVPGGPGARINFSRNLLFFAQRTTRVFWARPGGGGGQKCARLGGPIFPNRGGAGL